MKAIVIFIVLIMFFPTLANAKKCADFRTQQEAQKWYEERKRSGQTGWKNLDRDRMAVRAIACQVGMEKIARGIDKWIL